MSDTKLKQLCREFIQLLETVEETDSGREYHPTKIESCRSMDLHRIGEILKEMKKELE